MDANEMHREKTRWELHKNAASYLEQIPEATPHETTAVQPHTTYFKSYPSNMNKTLLEKQGQTHK